MNPKVNCNDPHCPERVAGKCQYVITLAMGEEYVLAMLVYKRWQKLPGAGSFEDWLEKQLNKGG